MSHMHQNHILWSYSMGISGAPNLLIRPKLTQRFGRTIRFGRILFPNFLPNRDSAEPNLQCLKPNGSAEPYHFCRIFTEPFDISFSLKRDAKYKRMVIVLTKLVFIKFEKRTCQKKKQNQAKVFGPFSRNVKMIPKMYFASFHVKC